MEKTIPDAVKEVLLYYCREGFIEYETYLKIQGDIAKRTEYYGVSSIDGRLRKLYYVP